MFKKIFLSFFILQSALVLSQEPYYSDVNILVTGQTLKDELAVKIINTHTNNLTYSEIWDATRNTDVNPNNAAEVLLMYGYSSSGQTSRTRDINNNGGSVGQWNREHVFSNSLGDPDLDQTGEDKPPYSDGHNLRSCDFQVNSTRSNRRFGSGSGAASGNSLDANGDGRQAWYPGDEWKGDVARIAMYMYLRYGEQCKPTFLGVGSSTNTFDDMIDLFLQWNAEDPVSDIEKQRNTYHGNTTNTFAQGNRNPFIDNPILATRIWGGPQAEDLWGIYTNGDTQAPTPPTSVIVSNITTNSIDVSWSGETDNVGVTSYDVYVDGTLNTSTTNSTITISGLDSNTTYSFYIVARDIANNTSAQSNSVSGTTLADTEAPTVPTNVMISNETTTSFKVTWDASTDNTAVTEYDIYLDGIINGSATILEYTVTNLSPSTTYVVTVLAKDAVNNMSAQSTPVNGTTTNGSGASSTELFISEYVEGSSNNKALEITNLTGASVDLSIYDLRRNSNGGANWSSPFQLSGMLANNDVLVLINAGANLQTLISEADIVIQNNQSTNFGEPLNFNGNDPVGLFKNGVLIDILGTFGDSSNFAKDKTLRRKTSVVNPNTTYTTSEWDELPRDTVENIGIVNSGVLSTSDEILENQKITIYPNPNNSNTLFVSTNSDVSATIFNTVGKQVLKTSGKEIDISNLQSGLYVILLKTESSITTKKLIRQ